MTFVPLPTQLDGDVWTVQLWRLIRQALNEGVMRPLGSFTAGVGGAASIDFTSIPQTHHDLVVLLAGRGTFAGTAVNVSVRFNGDTGANYDTQRQVLSGTTLSQADHIAQTNILTIGMPGSTAPASVFGPQVFVIPGYTKTAIRKSVLLDSSYKTANAAGGLVGGFCAGWWRNTAAITSVNLLPASGNFAEFSQAILLGVA